MKRKPSQTYFCLLAIGLAFTGILVSVILLERTAILSTAIKILRINTITPTPGPPRHLVCPSIPSTAILLPPAPYDEALGDCALIGKSGEIDAWLTELEQIAASCKANRETNWAGVLAVREHLDSQVDELYQPTEEGNAIFQFICPSYWSPELSERGEGDNPFSHHYTDWLKSIGEDVVKYCTMIDELVKPLWQACDEINFCWTDPETQHSIIMRNMNSAQLNYNYTDFFYTNSLLTYGWGNFRIFFNEASIVCPLVQWLPTPTPTLLSFVFIPNINPNCYSGPDQSFSKIGVAMKGVPYLMDGSNLARDWFRIMLTDSIGCWVPSSSGMPSRDISGLRVLFDIPTYTPTPVPVVCTGLNFDQCSQYPQCKWIYMNVSYCTKN